MVGAGVLTGKEIRDLELIDCPNDDNLKAASYDMTLGTDVIVCGQSEFNLTKLESKGNVTIAPFGRIVFSTSEKVVLTNRRDIVGRFDLKIRYGLDGLVLQVGPQVEPGYHGPLFGLILNTQGDYKTLFQGDPLVTVEFSRISTSVDERFAPLEITDLLDFLSKKRIDVDRLATPSLIQKVEDRLTEFQEQHQLQIEGTDRQRNIREVRLAGQEVHLAKNALWVAAVALILSLLISCVSCSIGLFSPEIRSFLGFPPGYEPSPNTVIPIATMTPAAVGVGT